MSPNLRIKLDKKIFWGKMLHFPVVKLYRERGEERVGRETPTSLYDLRSSIAWFSSGQELKSIYTARATRGYQKLRISLKIQVKSSEDRGFRLFGTSESFVLAPRSRNSSYFGLFFNIRVV